MEADLGPERRVLPRACEPGGAFGVRAYSAAFLFSTVVMTDAIPRVQSRAAEYETRNTQYAIPNPSLALHSSHFTPRTSPPAFSLIEILVTVALLSFIILGLLSMFTQTQRAFRDSMKQVDVMSSGRTVTDMLARELAQITPSEMAFTTNFFALIPQASQPPFIPTLYFAESSTGQPLLQGLPGTLGLRTNIIQSLFFVTRNNQDWIGTGYEVLADSPNAGVGTLYRFATNRNKANAIYLSSDFVQAPLVNVAGVPSTNLTRVADGVVHFRVRAFANNGFLISPPPGAGFPAWGTYPVINAGAVDSTNYATMPNDTWTGVAAVPDQVDYYYFQSNAVPAYLEVELGVLEPHILERFKGIGSGNPAAQRAYLSNHVAQVHVFRQRIPIRNVDFNAYQ